MRNIISILFYLIIFANVHTVTSQSVQEDDQLEQRIDDYLTAGVPNGLSGAVLVYKEGKVILNKGYGYADKEKEILNTPNTVFDIGSVSKQFTSAAILKLEEQGVLKVEDSLSKFFKDLPDDKKNITIHQLLIHSAGITRDIGKTDFDVISTADYFNELFSTKLIHKPGTKHVYSNAGYSILARIIEIASGQPYESFLNQYLFEPAGMHYTGYLLPKWDKLSVANGYSYDVLNIGSMLERYERAGNVSWTLKGNGGINSTQEDMLKWYQALKSNKVLSKALVEKMTTPYILEYEGETSYYAYGWVVFQTPRNTPMIAHDGSNGTFFYDYRWFPNKDVLIIYATNAFTSKIGSIGWTVDKMLFNETYMPKEIETDFVSAILNYSEKYEGSVDALKSKIIELFGSKITKSFYLNRLSGVYSRNGRLEKAILFAEMNIELFPQDSNIWDSLGQAYYDNGNLRKSIAAFKEAVSLDADNLYSQQMLDKLTK